MNASPLGHIAQIQAQAQSPKSNHNQNGLLSFADNNDQTPTRNGHARLVCTSFGLRIIFFKQTHKICLRIEIWKRYKNKSIKLDGIQH